MNEIAFHPLPDAFDAVARWLDGDASAEPATTRADRLAALFGLGTYERNVLLLTAYAALEPAAGDKLAQLHGSPELHMPNIGTLLAMVPGANWGALAADAGLRHNHLIEVSGGNALAGRTVAIAESTLFHLLGAPALSSEIANLVQLVDATPLLSPARESLRDLVLARSRDAMPDLLMLTGHDAQGKVQAMKAVCDRKGRKLCLLHASMLPGSTGELLQLARLLERDVRLVGGQLMLRLDGQAEEAPLRILAQALTVPLVLACDEPIVLPGRTAIRIETPRMSAREQAGLWRDSLSDLPDADEAIAQLSGNFRVTPELAASVRQLVSDDSGAGDMTSRIWQAARESVRPRMNELAQRVESTAQWDDLVLPARQKDVLADLLGQAKHRAKVYEDWGFGARLQERGLGISALLCGPSGAGKTMAGEIIANELGLDLYRIDLSSVVSKWLGETEKNIRRLFDAAEEGGVVMQFDEADALFGKRSEVKDSHDRHANIEVSYLLQKLEEFRGIAILTTNLKDNIDQAFLRRIRFVLDFRFPAQREREEIWRRIFPADVPLASLDFAALARLNIAGGTIRNIALASAFRAARDGEPVSMRAIMECARVEYDKAGRIMTELDGVGVTA